MQLFSHGLRAEFKPYILADDEDWSKVDVSISVPGFEGNFIGWLQTTDVSRFADELAKLQELPGVAGKARLACAESDIDIQLSMNAQGQILGHYRFESERRDHIPTTLSGAFAMDQTFLAELEKGARALYKALHRVDAS